MKVWEKLSGLENIGYNKEMVKAICKAKCPASIETKHLLIGDKRMKAFCAHGCSVICVDEYLELTSEAIHN